MSIIVERLLYGLLVIAYMFQIFISIDSICDDEYKTKRQFYVSLIPFIWIRIVVEEILEILKYIIGEFKKLK